MNTSRNLLIAAAAAISLAVVASSANAQASATGSGTATVQILKALSVASHHDLAFGKVAISATTAGAIAISESGTRSALNGAVLVGGTTVTPADFVFNGEPSQQVAVTYSDSAGAANSLGTYQLSDGGTNNVTLTITSSKTGNQTLDSSGNITVPIAGSVAIPAAQVGGSYTGSYYVTVAYY
jgi:hypothetical protein